MEVLILNRLKLLQIANYIFDPKVSHHSLHIISIKGFAIKSLISKVAHPRNPRIGIPWKWRKGRISRLMYDALRGNIELVSPD